MKYTKLKGMSYKEMGDKRWVEVYFDNETLVWVPKLSELGQICAMLGVCEDEKYNFPANKVQGAEMVHKFIKDSVVLVAETTEKIEELCEEYQIPK